MDAAEARAKIQTLLVTGDNRLKQGAGAAQARQSDEQALAAAREAVLDASVRLEDPGRLARELPRRARPGG